MEINYFRAAHSNNFISGLILWVLFFALVLGFIFHVLLGIFFLVLFIGQFTFFKGSIIDFENKSIELTSLNKVLKLIENTLTNYYYFSEGYKHSK